MELLAQQKSFEGNQKQYRHRSAACNCDMQFSIFIPEKSGKMPVLLWLSGLTCTDENFVTKAGAQRVASELGIIVVCPDTSPRGEDVPDDSESWDFGKGAGFYLNATQQPWDKNYNMYDYVVKELIPIVIENFPVDGEKISISGHSMGGHGAITIGLKNPSLFQSISAFSPITNPVNCPWGQKAFSLYLGENQENWLEYDSCHLVRNSKNQIPLLVDQGAADNFLEEQLLPLNLEQACAETDYPADIRYHEGYDHSYFFIASFIEEHLRFHAKFLSR